MGKKHVLITAKEERWLNFKKIVESAGYRVSCIPFIKTEPAELPEIPCCDYVFFNSPSSVRHFVNSGIKTGKMKAAALAAGTAAELKKHGITPFFKGKDTAEQSVLEFKKLLKHGETVLIPRSDRSKRRLQKALSEDQYREFVLYNTRTLNKKLNSQFDAVVFTSPGNVIGFITSGNKLPEVCISIGNTTAKELELHQISSVISRGYSPKDLAETVVRELK